jgi:hypothetical protein
MSQRPKPDQVPRAPQPVPANDDDARDPVTRVEDEEAEEDEDDADGIGVRPGG